jgi:hypothetical protein
MTQIDMVVHPGMSTMFWAVGVCQLRVMMRAGPCTPTCT